MPSHRQLAGGYLSKKKNAQNFAIMAEGPVDEIRELQSDIDADIQHLESAATPASSSH